MLPYSASKFALVGFSKGLQSEVKSGGVNVLTVCPWLMRTGSHLHAKVGGKKAAEYGWFSLGATLPLVAIPAQVAARQIVETTAKGKSELLISAWDVIASKIAANAPTWTATAIADEQNTSISETPVGRHSGRGTRYPGCCERLAECFWQVG